MLELSLILIWEAGQWRWECVSCYPSRSRGEYTTTITTSGCETNWAECMISFFVRNPWSRSPVVLFCAILYHHGNKDSGNESSRKDNEEFYGMRLQVGTYEKSESAHLRSSSRLAETSLSFIPFLLSDSNKGANWYRTLGSLEPYIYRWKLM